MLHKVRIYKKSQEEGTIVEIDGKELNNIVSLNFREDAGDMRLLTMTIVADVSIDTDANVKIDKLLASDLKKDIAEY